MSLTLKNLEVKSRPYPNFRNLMSRPQGSLSLRSLGLKDLFESVGESPEPNMRTRHVFFHIVDKPLRLGIGNKSCKGNPWTQLPMDSGRKSI